MIKALIFDCFGVFYVDPVFAYMNDPNTSRKKAEELYSLDKQAARGMLNEASFVLPSVKRLKKQISLLSLSAKLAHTKI